MDHTDFRLIHYIISANPTIPSEIHLQGAKTPRKPIPIPAKNRPANIISRFWAAVCKIPPRIKMTPATTTDHQPRPVFRDRISLLAVRRLNLSAIKEAGMEATNALTSSVYVVNGGENCLPEQERRYNETDVICVVGVVCCHTDSREEIRCFENVGDDTQIITEQSGAHAWINQLCPCSLRKTTHAAKQAQRKAYSFGGSIVSVCD